MHRSCAAKRSRQPGAPGSWPKRKVVANGECGEAGRRDLFGGKTHRNGAWRSTQSFRVVDGRFMRQLWSELVENGVGSGQP